MSETATPERPPSMMEMFREPAARNYVFVGLAALFIFYSLFKNTAGPEMGIWLLVLIAVPGLIARWVISPILFLILITYLLFDPRFDNLIMMLEGSSRAWLSSYGRRRLDLEFDHLLLGASILFYLIAQYRLLSLVHQSMPNDPPPRRKGQPEPTAPRRPAKLFTEREMAFALGIGLLSVLLGAIAWWAISGYERGEQIGYTWGIARPFARLMLFVWAFITGSILTGVLFRYLALRRMTRLEARLMLQDMFFDETRREQERIYRWQRWYRGRQATKAKHPGS